jgi:NitT/TauT family transport system substrate-binding protein
MIRALIGAASVAVLVTAASGPAVAVDKVIFQLGWLPTGDQAMAYVGIQKGYFAEEGLEVTIRSGRGSLDAVTKVATGVSDMGSGGYSAVMQALAESNAPVRAVMSLYTKMPDALMTYKGSGITVFKDVVGKTIATSSFSISNSYWPIVLQANGIDPASVKLLKVDNAPMNSMLAAGQVQATINWLPLAPSISNAIKQTGKELVVLPWSEVGYEGYGYAVFASDKMIHERPDVLRRMMKAYRRLLDDAIRDPAVVGEAIKAYVPESDQAITTAEFAASLPLIKNEISDRDGLGAFNPSLVKTSWEWLAKAQNYPVSKVDPEKVVDRSFLPK